MSTTKKLSKVAQIIALMAPDEQGITRWWSYAELEAILGFPVHGNGSPYFQNDRGVGLFYQVEKDLRGGVGWVRLVGKASLVNKERQQTIPAYVRNLISGKVCAMCATASCVHIDHKDGRKTLRIEQAYINDPNNYQPLCQHDNDVKRDACRRCAKENKRFDARSLGFSCGWINGDKYFRGSTLGCVGCYLYDPIAFRKAFRVGKKDEK